MTGGGSIRRNYLAAGTVLRRAEAVLNSMGEFLAAANTSRRCWRKPGDRWRQRCTRSEVSGGTPKIPRGRKIFLPRDCFRSGQIVHQEYGGFRFRPRPQRFCNRRRSPSTPRIAKSENAGMGRKMPFMDGHNLEIRELLVVIQRDHRLR
jgi:hypothetical protein